MVNHACLLLHCQERAALSKVRTEIERAANKLEAEKIAWDKKQVRTRADVNVGKGSTHVRECDVQS